VACDLFSSGFSTKISCVLASPTSMLHDRPISSSLTYETPHYAVSSIPLLSPYILLKSCSQHLQYLFLP